MPNPPPRSSGWPILVGAILAGLTAAAALCYFWGVSFLIVLLFFSIISILICINWLILALLDRWRAR